MTVRYAGARQAGLTEEKIASLHDEGSALFSARERIALRFAELMAVDHLKIDDALFAELRRHFTEAEIVELGVSIGLFLGLGRFNAVLQIDPV
jgi:alkylhydroperoxidase family enzyme